MSHYPPLPPLPPLPTPANPFSSELSGDCDKSKSCNQLVLDVKQQNDDLFSDLVCVVEMSSSYGEEEKRNIRHLIVQMGATLVDILGENVTHMICHDGDSRRIAIAQMIGVHVVSPDWLYDCIKSKRRSSEIDYSNINININNYYNKCGGGGGGSGNNTFCSCCNSQLRSTSTERVEDGLNSSSSSSSSSQLKRSICTGNNDDNRYLDCTDKDWSENSLLDISDISTTKMKRMAIPIPPFRPFALVDGNSYNSGSRDYDINAVNNDPFLPRRRSSVRIMDRIENDNDTNKIVLNLRNLDPRTILPVVYDQNWTPSLLTTLRMHAENNIFSHVDDGDNNESSSNSRLNPSDRSLAGIDVDCGDGNWDIDCVGNCDEKEVRKELRSPQGLRENLTNRIFCLKQSENQAAVVLGNLSEEEKVKEKDEVDLRQMEIRVNRAAFEFLNKAGSKSKLCLKHNVTRPALSKYLEEYSQAEINAKETEIDPTNSIPIVSVLEGGYNLAALAKSICEGGYDAAIPTTANAAVDTISAAMGGLAISSDSGPVQEEVETLSSASQSELEEP